MIESKYVWSDGELIAWEDATVHVLSHALHYGSGVFEGIRAYDTTDGTAVFRMREHYERLHRSAAAYGMPMRWTVGELEVATKEVLASNELKSGYVRPIVFYELGAIGLDPRNARVRTMIATWQWGKYLGEDGVINGIRLMTSSWRRFPSASFPNAKATGTYINSILAKREALQAGYDEALMLDVDGRVSEGSGENLFLVADGKVSTPSLDSGCLDGITRDTVMKLLRDQGYEVTEAEIAPEQLCEADELFLTGTAAEVTPVREVDDCRIANGKPGEVTRLTQRLFEETVTGRLLEYRDWLAYV
jgi:branched-chain amino acid aminotransferase